MPLNPCAVIRVSSDEQDHAQQLREVRRYCQDTLHTELADADIFLEHGVSGWANRTLESRPGLQRAVTACLAGRYTHLVVHKVDRSARNVALMAGLIDQLQAQGVIFVSVMEGLDTSQLGAAFVVKLLLTFAEHFGNNLSQEVKKGKRGRVAKGLANGHLPYGALRGSDGVPVPDLRPITLADGTITTAYAGLLVLWRLAASGENPAEVARRLNALGYWTESPRWKRGVWSRTTVRRLLDNRFYLGEVRDGADAWRPGAHRPLIALDLWDAAHNALRRHEARPDRAKRQARPRVFGRGMLRCGACQARGKDIGLHAARNERGVTYYICGERSMRSACGAPLVREDEIARQLLALLRWDIPDEILLAAVAVVQEQARGAQPDPAKAQAKLAHLRLRLHRIAELYELGEYARATYLERRKATQQEIAVCEATLRQAPLIDIYLLEQALAVVRDIPARWPALDITGQAAMVRTLFRAIWVTDGRITGVEPQPDYAPMFAVALPELVGVR